MVSSLNFALRNDHSVLQEGETRTCLPVPACSFPLDFCFHLYAQFFPRLMEEAFFFLFHSFLSVSICVHPSLTQPCLSLFSCLSISEPKTHTQPLPPINTMLGILLFAIIGVIGGFCQTTHSTSPFAYQGCASIDPSCFGNALVFSDGRLTPESCQHACQGHQFAALLPE